MQKSTRLRLRGRPGLLLHMVDSLLQSQSDSRLGTSPDLFRVVALGRVSLQRMCLAGAAPGAVGAVNPLAPQFFYDGWSCFRQLKDKDPPLVQLWSNPLKCKLTIPDVGF